MLLKKIITTIIESLIRNISGGLGQKIRFLYFKNRFKSCGINVRIDEGVIFHNPENIVVGNNVWIGSYSIITASPKKGIKSKVLYNKLNKDYKKPISSIDIRNNIHIGCFNIIQGYGGVILENNCTTSAYVKIYSQSNLHFSKDDPYAETGASTMIKDKIVPSISYPIILREGVWLAVGVCVYGGTIGKYTFVKTNSVVLGNLEEYSIYSGNPAKYNKKRYEDLVL